MLHPWMVVVILMCPSPREQRLLPIVVLMCLHTRWGQVTLRIHIAGSNNAPEMGCQSGSTVPH